MPLKHVRLELARSHEHPEGNHNIGYEFNISLTDDGRFDASSWDTDGQLCTVVKFTEHDDDLHGQLVQSEDGDWAFSYEPGIADDESIFRLESHIFKKNEYVTITDAEDEEHVYRVTDVGDRRFPAST